MPYWCGLFWLLSILPIIGKNHTDMKIKVKGNEYEVKSNVKSMIVFEGITEKPFEIKTVTDFYKYCYAMLYANNNENIPEFDEFLDWFDDEEIVEKFNEVMQGKPSLNDESKKKTKTQKK